MIFYFTEINAWTALYWLEKILFMQELGTWSMPPSLENLHIYLLPLDFFLLFFFFFFRACYSRKWRSGPRQAISTTPLRPHICRVPTSPFPVKAKEIPGSKYRGLSSRFITYHELWSWHNYNRESTWPKEI